MEALTETKRNLSTTIPPARSTFETRVLLQKRQDGTWQSDACLQQYIVITCFIFCGR